MKEHRLSKRVNSEKVCLLELGNEFYPATLKNISFGGALVRTPNMQHGLRIADRCTICMNGSFHENIHKLSELNLLMLPWSLSTGTKLIVTFST
jgi:hypothetical protein